MDIRFPHMFEAGTQQMIYFNCMLKYITFSDAKTYSTKFVIVLIRKNAIHFGVSELYEYGI
jgi:hypothetical protein